MRQNNLKGKNVFLTGATGLVGSHLTEKLIGLRANVFVTYRSNNPRSYFSEKKLGDKVVSVIGDIKHYDRVFDAITKYEIEYVFHAAAQPIVETAYCNPRGTLMDNVLGSINILEAVRNYPRVKAIVVASSDKAYGKGSINATEDFPMAGDHPYDVSKSCVDLIARMYAKTYNLPIVVSRFANIYGPGDLNFNRIIPGIMKAIITKEPLEIRSDGTFVRDYVYVKDVADGYFLLAENMEKIKGQAFNISAGYNFSVMKLIKEISKIVGKKCNYKIMDTQKNEIPEQSLNFEKIQKLLGWKSQYTFEKGIQETYNWYRDYFKVSL